MARLGMESDKNSWIVTAVLGAQIQHFIDIFKFEF